MHSRISSDLPVLILLGVFGSAISWRAIPIKSASFFSIIRAARPGSFRRPKAITGSLDCFFRAILNRAKERRALPDVSHRHYTRALVRRQLIIPFDDQNSAPWSVPYTFFNGLIGLVYLTRSYKSHALERQMKSTAAVRGCLRATQQESRSGAGLDR